MKHSKLVLLAVLAIFTVSAKAQSTLLNYDFNSASSYPVSPSASLSGITSSITSSETFQTYTGATTGSSAFTQNTTAGNAIAMANSSGANSRYFLITISGTSLNQYAGLQLYFQSQRSSTGATTISFATSTDGTNYTTQSSSVTVPTSFGESVVSLTGIAGSSNMYIKLLASGASGTGTLRIDNLELQGNLTTNAWQPSGSDIFYSAGNVGIGNSSPSYKLDVTGSSRVTADQIIGGNLFTSLTGGNTRFLQVDAAGKVIAGSSTNAVNTWLLGGNTNLTETTIGTMNGFDLPFVTDHHERMRITNTGKVGVGTNTPSAALEINSTQAYPSFLVNNPSYSGVFQISPDGSTLISSISTSNPPFTITNSNGTPFVVKPNGHIVINDDNSIPLFGSSAAHLQVNVSDQVLPFLITSKNVGGNSINLFGVGPDGSVGIFDNDPNDYNSLLTITHSNGSTLKFLGNGAGDIASSEDFRPHYQTTSGDFSVFQGVPGTGIMHFSVVGDNGITTIRTTDATLGHDAFIIQNDQTVTNQWGGTIVFNVKNDGSTIINSNSTTSAPFTINNQNGQVFQIGNNGAIHIGTKVPNVNAQHFDALLSVYGKVLFTSAYVNVNTNIWSDYVFEKNYKLLSLQEVEQFYSQNKHLPGVPSAKEIEVSGDNLVQTDATLLKKIEELTIYIVEQQKQIDELSKKLKSISKYECR